MAQAKKRPNSDERKAKRRERELREDIAKTEQHITNLNAREASLRQEFAQVDAARQQLIGRIRTRQEDLGEVPPLTDPAPTESDEEEDDG